MKKTIIRIILSPIIFIIHAFLSVVGIILPTTAIAFIAFISLISRPFIFLINLGMEKKLNSIVSPFDFVPNPIISEVIGLFGVITFPIWAVIVWIKKGEFLITELEK